MRFSILIPVYNVEKYLPVCMESVMGQTFRDFEVILADDGSFDGSGALCDMYAEKYPDTVRVFHKENEGLLLTRRYSLSRASGEYMIFVDSDDYIAPTLLEEVDRAIVEKGADMVIYNLHRFVEGEEEVEPTVSVPFADGAVLEGEEKKNFYTFMILRNCLGNLVVKAVRRDIVDIAEDYTDKAISKGEDLLQSLPLVTGAQRMVYIDRGLYFYRKNSGSMTLNVRKSDYFDAMVLQENILRYIDLWGLGEEIKYPYLSRQMIAQYHWLRAIYKKSRASGDGEMFRDTLVSLCSDERFRHAMEMYRAEYSPRRTRTRLRLFRRFALRKRWGSLTALIRISNLFGR